MREEQVQVVSLVIILVEIVQDHQLIVHLVILSLVEYLIRIVVVVQDFMKQDLNVHHVIIHVIPVQALQMDAKVVLIQLVEFQIQTVGVTMASMMMEVSVLIVNQDVLLVFHQHSVLHVQEMGDMVYYVNVKQDFMKFLTKTIANVIKF